jgi:hypothetical protein
MSARASGLDHGGPVHQRFIEEGVKWAHLDIAGMVWADKPGATWDKGATGYGVKLLDRAWRDDALTFKRAFYFFDQSTIADARTCWKKLKGTDGVEPRFWRQEGGRWMEGP